MTGDNFTCKLCDRVFETTNRIWVTLSLYEDTDKETKVDVCWECNSELNSIYNTLSQKVTKDE